MAMASPSTSTAVTAAASESEPRRLGGIEDLKLKVGPVRRNLFGPVDHRQLQRDFQRLLCMSVEVANKRWNFDFQSDRPAQGSAVEWEELRCQDVPAFYRSCTVRRAVRPAGGTMKTKAPRRPSPSSGGSSPSSKSSSSGSGDEYLEVTTKGCYRLQRLGKRRQPSITDFFKVKKRRLLHYKGSSRQ
ncbi:cyclin-dependent kinase inhibitor 1D [Centroberyx affinis]|uniref:cyclin-dependent kinase inhibitor 1D n=1 Tax=Centroberyx affinis TaxID=166261 RepID=UPI003A5BF435